MHSIFDQIVSMMLNAGADPNLDCGDRSGCSALHTALKYGHTDILRILLEGPKERTGVVIDVESRDSTGFTPLMIAAIAGNLQQLDVLLEIGNAAIDLEEMKKFDLSDEVKAKIETARMARQSLPVSEVWIGQRKDDSRIGIPANK